MKLYFKQRFFSWFDSYDIYDYDTGDVVYTVEGHEFLLRAGSASGAFPAAGGRRHLLTWPNRCAAGLCVPAVFHPSGYEKSRNSERKRQIDCECRKTNI